MYNILQHSWYIVLTQHMLTTSLPEINQEQQTENTIFQVYSFPFTLSIYRKSHTFPTLSLLLEVWGGSFLHSFLSLCSCVVLFTSLNKLSILIILLTICNFIICSVSRPVSTDCFYLVMGYISLFLNFLLDVWLEFYVLGSQILLYFFKYYCWALFWTS